jgi:hypothetical protein
VRYRRLYLFGDSRKGSRQRISHARCGVDRQAIFLSTGDSKDDSANRYSYREAAKRH